MTRLFITLVLFFLTYTSILGQSKQKFEFTDIDSIVEINIKKLSKDSFIIVHQVWNVGAYFSNKKKKLFYNNPFELIFYYNHNRRNYIRKINNLGESKDKHYWHFDMNKFIESNFALMQNEVLTRKIDTIENSYTTSDGQLIKSWTFKQSIQDHQQSDRIWIYYNGKSLSYYFPKDFENNKWNHYTYQYKFLKLLQKRSKSASKKLRQVS